MSKIEKFLTKGNIILFFIAIFCFLLFLNLLFDDYFGQGLNIMLVLGIITFGFSLYKIKIK